MATVVESRSTEDRGLGVLGAVAIIAAVLIAAFFLFRWTGAGNEGGAGTGAEVNVSGSLDGGAAGSY